MTLTRTWFLKERHTFALVKSNPQCALFLRSYVCCSLLIGDTLFIGTTLVQNRHVVSSRAIDVLVYLDIGIPIVDLSTIGDLSTIVDYALFHPNVDLDF